MADLRHLYQDTLLEHYRHPRNAHALPDPDARASRQNPTCGDACDASVNVDDDRIVAVSVVSRGCTVAVASASILSELCEGLERTEAQRLLARAGDLICGRGAPREDDPPALAALAALRDYPTRHNCALLARDALRLALDDLDPRGGRYQRPSPSGLNATTE